MIRITTNGTLRGYQTNLNRSSVNLSQTRDKVLTQRNFNSYAEDPAAATQAFKLRRSFSRTSDQLSNTQSVTKKFESAWDAINTVKSNLTEKTAKVSALSGINGSTGTGRQPLGKVLAAAADSVVQTMNSQYGTSFIFAGNDALSGAPFAWNTDGDLTYRGIAVDSASAADQQKLQTMSAETSYVDIGSGLSEQNGEVLNASAFNAAISGLQYLGYGTDADGDPKNAASLMKELSDIFTRCDADTGAYANATDEKDANRLCKKLQGTLDNMTNEWSTLSGKASYLTGTEDRLTNMVDDLNNQILQVEQVDLASAITDFSWAQYCYNAALKVGNSILSQSLIDYMN
ncbi:MAG: hypothetical protein VB023_05525 [Oscillibacter sp.]|nr:hypothetical protein [Oscillibacter sp.]